MKQRNEIICGLSRRQIGDMAEIERLCFSQPWSQASLEGELANPLAVYFVCEGESGVLGYIGTRMLGDECHITNVAVHPDHRRRGIAKRLLAELEQRSRAHGMSMMTLEVRESNVPARIFYQSAGFVPMGKRKNYYELPREDGIIMTKMLEEVEIGPT